LGLIGDELVEISIGEHAPSALGAPADGDVFQLARGDVTVGGFDRAAQHTGGFDRRTQTIRR